jgi:chromosome segregation ATPase
MNEQHCPTCGGRPSLLLHDIEVNELRQRVADLESTLNGSREITKILREQLAACEKERDELQAIFDHRKNTVVDLRAELTASQQRIAELEQIEAAAKNLADVKGRHHTEKAYNKLMDSLQAKNQRINELETVIKQHGIPVKTYAGGEAHYVMGSEG